MLTACFAALLLCMPLTEETLLSRMPADGTPSGWGAAAAGELFNGGALYRPIDGGAELFLQHGFVVMAQRDYRKDALEVRIEIYEMKTPEGAAAVFDENSKGIATTADVGESCTLDQYQTVFLRGRYYVTITCFEPGDEVYAAMQALAKTVDANLQR